MSDKLTYDFKEADFYLTEYITPSELLEKIGEAALRLGAIVNDENADAIRQTVQTLLTMKDFFKIIKNAEL